jgi:hypothetical protein
MTLAVPQAMIRATPQQLATRTMRDKFTLLRKGAQATISSRGCSSIVGGLWRWWTKSLIEAAQSLTRVFPFAKLETRCVVLAFKSARELTTTTQRTRRMNKENKRCHSGGRPGGSGRAFQCSESLPYVVSSWLAIFFQ